MYIRSYQIHNVLNVYRKQLSSGPGIGDARNPHTSGANDRISISADGQRQSIMEKITTEIVERITQSGPENQFEAVLSDRLSGKSQKNKAPSDDEPDFKYMVIDENNQKTTHRLPIRGIRPNFNGTASKVIKNMDQSPVSEID